MAAHRLSLKPDLGEIPGLIEWVERCCGAAGLGSDISFRLALALEEAVANVIHHGFAGRKPPHRIEVRLDIGAESLVATVIDNGIPFDPSSTPDPTLLLPVEQREPGGLGILLIRRMVDRVEYRRVGGENRLRLEKSRG
jgi:anti-sigma regulatory factor (Ser/Thr protein kinase)